MAGIDGLVSLMFPDPAQRPVGVKVSYSGFASLKLQTQRNDDKKRWRFVLQVIG